MAPSKNVKISQQQQEIMLDFMIQHTDFSFGRCKGPQGKKELSAVWDTLATRLNSVGVGPIKCAFKWKASWIDWKGKTTAKANRLEQQRNGILSETQTPKLSELEEKLMELISTEIVPMDLEVEEDDHEVAIKAGLNVDEADILDATDVEQLQFEIADDEIDVIINEVDPSLQLRDRLTSEGHGGYITEVYEQAMIEVEKPRPRILKVKNLPRQLIPETKPYFKQENVYHEKATGKIETVQQENLKVNKEILQRLTEIASATQKNVAYTARMTIALEAIAAKI